jgi:predicted NBD/HSP70 family sugar kinase
MLMLRTPPTGRPSTLRDINAQAVLELLRKNGPMSRTGLAGRLQLSKSTVSAVVASLVTQRLVRETGATPAARTAGRRSAGGAGPPVVGRRPVMLEINPDAGYVAGVDLGATLVRIIIADLTGQVRARARARTDRGGVESLLDQIERLLASAAEQARVPRRKILTLAMGLPSAVTASGEMRLCQNLPFLDGVRLGELLSTRLGLPVVMDNDANLAAIGEKWRGGAAEARNFAYLAVGTGIGMGVIIDGELYRGASGYAGEIGYFPVPEAWRDGGAYIPVETLIAGPGISRRAGGRSPEEVFAGARRGDPAAREVVGEIARTLAWVIACANVSLNLERVVLGGGVGSNTDLLLPAVQQHLDALIPFPPQVVPSTLEGDATLYGAVAVALRRGRARVWGRQR